MRTRIVIFAKAPVAGKVKTRLILALGPEGAAELARRMLLDTVREALQVEGVEVELCVDPEPGDPTWRGLLPPTYLSHQGEGDLGERLARSSARVLGDGRRVVLIGTDCPELDARRLAETCAELDRHDAVIHPALDGGYVLLGLRRFHSSVFSGIEWSTPSVARATIGRIKALGWSCHLGATLQDIDEPEDLKALSPRA